MRPVQAATRNAFRLFTDGASRGNPGRAGIGAALYNDDDMLQATLSSFIGHSTSNAAEYRACLQGLLMARVLRVSRVVVLSDSQLMVRHMQGRYAVRNQRLKRLHALVTDATKAFQSCRFSYIGREYNEVADRLANDALDSGRRNHVVLEQPCMCIAVGSALEQCDVELATPVSEQSGVQ